MCGLFSLHYTYSDARALLAQEVDNIHVVSVHTCMIPPRHACRPRLGVRGRALQGPPEVGISNLGRFTGRQSF